MSYLKHFSFKEQPFSSSISQRFFYGNVHHSEALVRLTHAADSGIGLALLVGETGSGKTVLAHRLLEELDEKKYDTALLMMVHVPSSPAWLLRAIASQIGVENPSEERGDVIGELFHRLVQIQESGKKAVVIIDDAHMLRTKEMMEELKGILNMEMDGQKLVTFVLLGLPEMEESVSQDEGLRQRVALWHQLPPLEQELAEDYIRHRLRTAGAKKDPFSQDAIACVYQYSRGIPRLINIICDNALLEGFLQKRDKLDEKTIERVVQDLKLPFKD